ncbi:MAG: ABC-F family ATP-binding cassette domain-containing protein [Lachnospiraceae bacterium]|nr:ABC-F family ATP-binding cassette domain-containing protein [Lachnospiraceae bacterium]
MNLLTAEHLKKVFTQRVLLDDADFSINEGEKIGVIGINGTGKSTLLRIIAGLEEADEGTVTRGRNLTIRYLPQTPVFDKGATVLEAILKNNINELNQWNIESEAMTAINRLGLPAADEKIEHLSGGQRKRIALANAVLAPVDILVLDEPTNHLDSEMAAWLEDYLNDFRGAIVMVTHDRYFLDSIATRIVEIDKGKLYSYPGDYAAYLMLKAERQNMEIATERKRQSLLRTELQWLSRGARARSTKQKAHIDRIRAMQARQGPVEESKIQISSVGSRMGRTTVELKDICKSYGDHYLIHSFTYIFLKNDRIGIVGPNGCGKSTLLKIINGIVTPDGGDVTIGQTIRIGYFSQESEDMDDSLIAIDYIKEVGEYIKTSDGRITASQMMERFLFDGTMQWSKIEKLSGGEKRRLYLLRVLMSEPNVLILDEPTNDLDIQTLEILEEYLDSFDGIVITVSHDRYFLDRIAKRIFAFEGNGRIRQYEGGYSDYLNARPDPALPENRSSIPSAVSTGQVGQNTAKPPSDSRKTWGGEKKLKFTYKEQKEFEIIDDEIAALEERLSSLEKEMEDAARDYGRLNQIMQEKDQIQTQLDFKMERWLYLNELQEKIESQNAGAKA